MVLQTICGIDADLPDAQRLAITLWITTSGGVARVKLLDSFGERRRDAALSAAFERGDVGSPPPAGLKQPITLVVRPLPSRNGSDCSSAGSETRRASN